MKSTREEVLEIIHNNVDIEPMLDELFSKFNVTHKKIKEESPIVKIVKAYKIKQGFKIDDTSWDKLNFGRCSRSAKMLLEYFRSWETPVRCIDELGTKFNKEGLSWTIETICKHASSWDLQRTKND